ncbi:MAG: NAD kinase [Actinomycetota bacterium]|nr:NAD kinase [Actinomycetota bacterium]
MRNLLLVVNPSRPAAVAAAKELAASFSKVGFSLYTISDIALVNVTNCTLENLPALEVGVVLGGDGTMLRAAEATRLHQIPLLGVNLGHVGFLAEVEKTTLERVVSTIADKSYVIDPRMTLKYSVVRKGVEVAHGWALNEVMVEREDAAMIELFLEIDRRPISRWGCDGLICSTPTGSTAYAFSAGGPVVWPEVDAFVVLPISAHALFSRALVISTHSQILVRVESARGLLSADSLRNFELIEADQVHISKDNGVVTLAHLHQTLFSDRLVAKFKLPIQGWRGE